MDKTDGKVMVISFLFLTIGVFLELTDGIVMNTLITVCNNNLYSTLSLTIIFPIHSLIWIQTENNDVLLLPFYRHEYWGLKVLSD